MKLINHRDNNVFIQVMAEKLKDNKRIYLFWPYKTGSRSAMSQSEVVSLLTNACGRQLKSMIYNADEMTEKDVKETLIDPGESWKDLDIVVVNQCITVGVNYDREDVFDSVFVADTLFVTMREIVQTSRRIRHLKTNEIHYTNISSNYRSAYPINDTSSVPREYIEDILTEIKSKSQNGVKWLFNRSNVLVDSREYKVDEEFKEFYRSIVHDDKYDWDAIKDIDDSEVLQRLFACGAGSSEEAVMLIKYKFREMLNCGSELVLKEAWQFRSSLEKHYKMKNELKDVFNIKTESLKIGKGINDILTKEQRGTLIKNFSFRGIDSGNSSDAKMLADSYNSLLGLRYYEYDKNKMAYVRSDTGESFDDILQQIQASKDEGFMFVD